MVLFDPTKVPEGEWHAVYRHFVNDVRYQEVAQTRDYLLRLHSRFSSLLDSNFVDQFVRKTPTRIWELQCAELIAESGHQLRPSPGGVGPDFWATVDRVDVGFECVAPSNGDGANAVPILQPGQIGFGNDTEITRRLTQVIAEKRGKALGWRNRQPPAMQASNAFVICITAADLDLGDMEQLPDVDLPRIVKLLFGLGRLQYLVDLDSGRPSGTRHEHRDQVLTARGSPVATNLFLDSAHCDVSAIYYTRHHVKNRPETRGQPLGSDAYVIHNPLATIPLPRGRLRCAFEFYADGDRLRWVDHHSTECLRSLGASGQTFSA